MPVKFVKLYTDELIAQHPDWLFVFGDNYERKGTGGQAKVCRGKPNVIGWPTKRAANHLPAALLKSREFEEWLEVTTPDREAIEAALHAGKTVVFPEDGIGTGLAKLEVNAPNILNYINEFFGGCVERYGLI